MKKILLITILFAITALILGCSNEINDPTSITGNTIIADTGSNFQDNNNPTITPTEEIIEIPLSGITRTVKFFEYNDNGITIRYFAVLGSDGNVRTAFDACDVCGGYKGYEQRETDIVCKNCGRAFLIDGLGTKNTGYGCWPSYLSHKTKDNKIIISVDEIKKARAKFA